VNATEIIRELVSKITLTDVFFCLPGTVLLSVWLYKTSFGTKALAESVPRRNNMPLYMPFLPLFTWISFVTITVFAKQVSLSRLPRWESTFLDNLFISLGAIGTTAVIVLLARTYFARGLKGFGLRFESILKDFASAVLNLISIYPVVAAVLLLTIFSGKVVYGSDFDIQRHEELEILTEYPQLPVRVMVVVTTVLAMPVFEEMLFRGLFQSMIRSFLWNLGGNRSAWLSIAICSALFATVHANKWHWPALFALSMCLGYSYEKSGSLFRPIFIHALFNATSIIGVLAGR